MPDQSTDGTESGGSTSDEITPKPDNDEFVILFTNDFHSQIEPADNGKYGLDKYIIRRDSPEYVRDYFGEITGPLDGRVRYE